ncbi:MAG: TatD family hydrolase [Candidatus Peregrinibacteria bacterium]
MIDSHCHLTDKAFSSDLDAVIERASQAGVSTIITIADSIQESEKALRITQKYEHIFCTIGVHPHHAHSWQASDATTVRALVGSSRKVRGIGEIGLDYHYDFSPRDIQKKVFREQMEIAVQLKLPAVIHCREAIGDVKAVLKDFPAARAVLHCCSERWEDVAALVDAGHMLSFTGIATYPNAAEIRRTIALCPLAQMMVETDAPYLAPVPHRGKRNEPAYVPEVAQKIAEIKGVPLEEVDRVTTENAVAFFALSS